MEIDEQREREAFEAELKSKVYVWRNEHRIYVIPAINDRYAGWLARAAQPVRVSREALCRALNDNHSPDVSFADITEAALKALGIEVIDA